MTFHPRSEVWPGQTPTSTTGAVRPRLSHEPYLTVHYTGSGLWLDKDDTPAELRVIQSAALSAGKPWEYNYVIDGQGETWEYAGDYQAAHVSGHNNEAVGVLLLIGLADSKALTGFEKPTDEMILAFRQLRHSLAETGLLAQGHVVRQHKEMPDAKTMCPGPMVIERWPEFLAPWEPPAPPPPPTTGDPMAVQYLELADAFATFLVQPDVNGTVLEAKWVDGASAANLGALKLHKARGAKPFLMEDGSKYPASIMASIYVNKVPGPDALFEQSHGRAWSVSDFGGVG